MNSVTKIVTLVPPKGYFWELGGILGVIVIISVVVVQQCTYKSKTAVAVHVFNAAIYPYIYTV